MTEIIIPEPPITLENAFLLHLMESNADLRLHLECIQDFQKDYIQSKVIKKYNNLNEENVKNCVYQIFLFYKITNEKIIIVFDGIFFKDFLNNKFICRSSIF